jgi:hypothetical protein
MIVAIHQPHYVAWPGYFDKIDRADVFVFLDTVQFKKNEFQNRNLIKGPRGPQWLTVPVIHRFGQTIGDVRINDDVDWGKKHLAGITSCYGKAPFFKEYIGHFEKLLGGRREARWEGLSELNIACSRLIARLVGITTPLVVASDLGVTAETRDGRLIEISERLGGDIYLSGAGGRDYVDEAAFAERGIGVIFQEFTCPEYPQLFGKFVPNLSIIDMLFNVGARTIDYLRGRTTT